MTWTLTLPLRRARLARAAVATPQPASAEPARPASPAPPAPSAAGAQPRLRDWIGVLAMGTGLFMAIMDVQIVTSSLTQIQGGLSASVDEIAWVQTAYLIADVVMVPLSGMMSRLLSTRILFVVAAVVWVTIDIDKPDLSLLRHFDLIGLVLMASFLACLEYALQEGPRWDWFDDDTIRATVLISIIAGSLFFWRVFTYHQPIVDLSTFRNRNFAFGTFFTFTMGIGMYGTTYLVPLFLAQVRGYNAWQIGCTVIVIGLVTMVLSPLSTRMARLLDLRVMLAIGFGLFAYSMYLTATLTNQTGFWELFLPQVVRGMGLICCYLPANMIAMGSLPADRMRNAAGLYNLTRDLGGAIGLAAIVTIMNARLHFHWNRLVENINPARPAVQHFLEMQANRLDAMVPDSTRAAMKLLAQAVQREALVLTYNDLLILIGLFFVGALLLLPLVGRPRSMMAH